MRPGRELDCFVAENVLKHPIKVKQRQLWEITELGERPLKKYTRDMAAAWEIAEKMGITVIPVQPNTWFAFVGKGGRWENPAEFIAFLQKGDFLQSGAAVGEDPAETICQAAFHAIQKTPMAQAPTVEENPQLN
ncbi:MAG: hypothetical protein AABZ31_10875 [Bdellovibrionota bacterium]